MEKKKNYKHHQATGTLSKQGDCLGLRTCSLHSLPVFLVILSTLVLRPCLCVAQANPDTGCLLVPFPSSQTLGLRHHAKLAPCFLLGILSLKLIFYICVLAKLKFLKSLKSTITDSLQQGKSHCVKTKCVLFRRKLIEAQSPGRVIAAATSQLG